MPAFYFIPRTRTRRISLPTSMTTRKFHYVLGLPTDLRLVGRARHSVRAVGGSIAKLWRARSDTPYHSCIETTLSQY